MPTLRLSMMLMKTNGLCRALHDVDEKKGGYALDARPERVGSGTACMEHSGANRLRKNLSNCHTEPAFWRRTSAFRGEFMIQVNYGGSSPIKQAQNDSAWSGDAK